MVTGSEEHTTGDLRGPRSTYVWLSEIAATVIYAYTKVNSRPFVDTAKEESRRISRPMGSGLAQTKFDEALAELPLNQQLILRLHDLQQFSYRQIARMLALPLGTVHSRNARARQLLRSSLNQMSSSSISELIGARPKGLVRKDATDAESGGAVEASQLTEHAVVVGYGVKGRYLARMLQAAGIACAVVDQSAELVRLARANGLPAVCGDGVQHVLLERVACARARVIVFTISSPVEARRGVAVAREVAPAAQIVVHTAYVHAVDGLMQLGANQVVVEKSETSLELFACTLESYAIPATRIAHELAQDAGRG